jgi:hypothetical protein
LGYEPNTLPLRHGALLPDEKFFDYITVIYDRELLLCLFVLPEALYMNSQVVKCFFFHVKIGQDVILLMDFEVNGLC